MLKRALDPALSFESAGEFYAALSKLEGLQIRRHEPRPPSTAPVVPFPPQAGVPPPLLPAKKKKVPLAFVGGLATVAALGAAVYFTARKPVEDTTPKTEESAPHFSNDNPEVVPDAPPVPIVIASATPPPAPPAPATPPPPTRQDRLKVAVDAAQALEEKGDWANSLEAWLRVAHEYPESGVGRNHLETLLNHLRDRPSPITPDEFKTLRPQIVEAAQLDILSAMLLIADNVRETEPHIAFNWYSAAAARRHPQALTQLGLLLSNGTGTASPDLGKAVQCFQAAAELGDPAGKAALAECYLSDKRGVARDEKRAVSLLREAAAQNYPLAINRLGDCAARGIGGKVDYAEAFRLFSQAAERKLPESFGNLAILYMKGNGVSEDPKKAAENSEKGARLGSAFCMRLYAWCFENGYGAPRNFLQASSWYRKAAEGGDAPAAEWCRKNNVSANAR